MQPLTELLLAWALLQEPFFSGVWFLYLYEQVDELYIYMGVQKRHLYMGSNICNNIFINYFQNLEFGGETFKTMLKWAVLVGWLFFLPFN